MARLKLVLNNERLVGLLAAGLAFFGSLQLIRGFTALFAPVSTDYSEMMVAGMAQQLLNTGRLAFIYTPPDAPYGMPGVQYPPIFIALTTLLMKISGLEAVLTSRLLAWGGYAVAGAIVGLIVWRETGQRFLAFCAAFFPFTFWSVLIFINGARPDPLALFLSLLGALLYREVYHGDTKTRREVKNLVPFYVNLKLAGVALVLVLAFYSKQTYLASAAAVFFDLLLTKGRRRQALVFGGCYVIFSLIGFWLCQVFSEGQFAGIFDTARAGRFIFHLAPAMVGYFLLDHAAIIIIAIMGIVWQWRQGQKFWPLYVFFAALACSSIVKDGAVDYYFNELAYLLATQAALAIAKYQAKYQVSSTKYQNNHPLSTIHYPPSTKSSFLPLLLAIQMLIAGGMLFAWNQWKDNDSFGGIYQEARAIVQEYRQTGRPALVLQNNFLIETGQTNLIGDYFIYWILIGNGHRDIKPFQSDLDNRRYDMILVGSPEFRRWPTVLEQVLERGYNLRILAGTDGRQLYWLYTKKG